MPSTSRLPPPPPPRTPKAAHVTVVRDQPTSRLRPVDEFAAKTAPRRADPRGLGVHFLEQATLTTIDESDDTTFRGGRRLADALADGGGGDDGSAAGSGSSSSLESSSVVSSISNTSDGGGSRDPAAEDAKQNVRFADFDDRSEEPQVCACVCKRERER